MQNVKQLNAVEQLQFANEFTSIVSDINVGLAVYSNMQMLLTANSAFYELHDIEFDQAQIGTPMAEVVQNCQNAKRLNGANAKLTCETVLDSLSKNGHYAIEARNKSGQRIYVNRQKKPNGMVVETVTAVSSNSSDLKLDANSRLHHADNLSVGRVMDAVDRMSDGLAVFNADGILIAMNETYRQLNAEIYDVLKIGTSHDEIITAVYESGKVNLNGMTREAFLEYARSERLNPSGATMHQRYDGVWVRFNAQRMENGDTVFTSSDISILKEHETERKRLGDAVESERKHLNDALTNMSQGICVFDSDQRMVVSNQQFINMAGFDPELAKPGARRIDLIHSAIERGHYVGDHARTVLKKHIEEGFPAKESTYLYHLFDGRVIEVHNKSLDDGRTIVTNTDVTQRETDAAIIEEQSQQFTDALKNMSQGLALFDQQNRLVLNNEQYLDMTGIDRSIAVPGARRIDLLKSAIRGGQYTSEKAGEALAKYENEGFPDTDSTYLHHLANGNIIEISNKPLADGTTIVTSADVTRRENDATRLAKYTLNLERSNAELQDFAYVASHDLQEPLRKIEAFGDRLTKKYGDQLPEDGQMYLDRMQNAASRMRQLINDLLSYSRVTSKARPFDSTDLNDVVEGVLSDIQMRLEDTGGKIEISGLEQIDCDALQMRQLFQNLISNALKFQKAGVEPRVMIKGELLSETEEFGAETMIHRIQVSDNGIGFESRFKDQIFAIFKRLHGRMEYEGTGIGLSTCRKIVERHHGTIEADSVLDGGATFTINIPVKHKAEDQ